MAVRHTGERLPTDDAVEDQESLHREDGERARNDRPVISTQASTPSVINVEGLDVPPGISSKDHRPHAQLGAEDCPRWVIQVSAQQTIRYGTCNNSQIRWNGAGTEEKLVSHAWIEGE